MCAGGDCLVTHVVLTVQLVLLVAASSRVVPSAQDNEQEDVEDRQGEEASKCTDQSSAQHACHAWEDALSFSVGVEQLCHQDCKHSHYRQQCSCCSVGETEASTNLCSSSTVITFRASASDPSKPST